MWGATMKGVRDSWLGTLVAIIVIIGCFVAITKNDEAQNIAAVEAENARSSELINTININFDQGIRKFKT